MTSRRVTQADIARKAKVTQTTVSLAMRCHPSVPEPTRQRILNLAAKMGYRPDPMLSSLVAYRRAVRQASFQGVLAWVTNYPTENGWSNGQQIGYFQGAEQRARELGYKLETIWLRQPGLKPDRIRQILQTRGIQGLLLTPQPQPHTVIEQDWAQFSSVAFGYTLQQPQLHMVMNHQFRNMANLIRKLHDLGHRRVGFAMPSSQDERVENNYLAGYLVEQQKLPRADRVPHLLDRQFGPSSFFRWLEKHGPRVIVTDLGTAPRIREWLKEKGCAVPREVGLALPNVPFGDRFYAGIDESPLLVGATAVDVVVGMIHRSERGVPANPRYILIEGRWFDGQSLGRPV
jgi:LacI family transcriptional regulator